MAQAYKYQAEKVTAVTLTTVVFYPQFPRNPTGVGPGLSIS